MTFANGHAVDTWPRGPTDSTILEALLVSGLLRVSQAPGLAPYRLVSQLDEAAAAALGSRLDGGSV